MTANNDPNIFLLTVDSLAYKYFKDSSKQLAEVCSGTEFTQAIATSSDTNSAMPGLAASVYTDTVPGWGLPSENPPTTFASALNENGYNCGMWSDNYLFSETYNYGTGFSGGNLGKPSWKKQVINRIRKSPAEPILGLAEWAYFNVFTPVSGSIKSQDETLYRTAEDLNQQALSWLPETTSPLFCWVHYMDTHHPYEPPTEYLKDEDFNGNWSRGELGQFTRKVIKNNGDGFDDNDIEDVTAAYQACCEYLADELLEFIKKLKELNHFDPETDILAITADHGESLSPQRTGTMGHVPPAFWEEIVNVPLILSLPQWKEGTVQEQVSLIDLMPTILGAVGIDTPNSAEGSFANTPQDMVREKVRFASQWGPSGEELSRTYRGARTNDGKKVFGAHAGGIDKVVASYINGDVDKVATEAKDREEIQNMEAGFSDLVSFIEQHGPCLSKNDYRNTNKATKDHLSDLGYLE